MSAKEALYKMAMKSITLLYLCTQAQARKAISKKEYRKIKDVIQEIEELAEQLP